jgi:hypothetical protein
VGDHGEPGGAQEFIERMAFGAKKPKEDQRPKRGFWAPGSYDCTCTKCGDLFIGDKRAVVCADCAYKV